MNTATTKAPTQPTTDPRTLFAAAAATARTTLAAVSSAQMTLPTPCETLDVRMLMGHLLAVVHRVSALAEGGDPFSVPDVIDGIADADWVREWDAATARFDAAWADDALLAQVMVLPWAQLPGAAIAAMYTSEVSVHTWDLATATGQRPDWNAEAIQVSLATMHQALPAYGRIEEFEAARARMPEGKEGFNYPFGEAVATAANASLIDQLVAWTGRTPR